MASYVEPKNDKHRDAPEVPRVLRVVVRTEDSDCGHLEALHDQYSQPLDPAPSQVYRACLPYLKDGITSVLALGGTCQSEVAS